MIEPALVASLGEVLSLTVPNAVAIAVSFAILGWDERRLSETELSRAWPPASRRMALVVFSPLCLLVHFARTRRSPAGVALGFGGAAIAFAASYVALVAIDSLVRAVADPS